MIHIWTRPMNGRTYESVPNGPFPISIEQLNEARRIFRLEFNSTPPMTGIHLAPQSSAREILRQICPTMSDFDALQVGFTVSSMFVRMEEA